MNKTQENISSEEVKETIKTLLFVFVVAFLLIGANSGQSKSQSLDQNYVKGKTPVEAGKYLIIVGGCNDCHTPGYMLKEGDVPEEQWLIGWDVGFRGPWGTTYASNLRLLVQDISEEQWVKMLSTRKKLPPMPWMNVNQMSEKDMRAIYDYIKSLETKGTKTPENIGPGEDPKTPFIRMAPQNMSGKNKKE